MRYQTLKLRRMGRRLTITLSRPDRLNAVDARMHTELARVFLEAAEDDRNDIVVLTGAGRAFCAGGDLEWQRDALEDPASFERTIREARQIVLGMLECDKPIVAMINGPAVGLGATMALFADIAFMAEDTFLSDPHVNVGMTAGDGGAAIWPQLVGYQRAKYYLFTGEKIAATEAARIGLIAAAVPGNDLVRHVDAFVDRILSLPQQAIRSTKRSINTTLRELTTTSLEVSLALESIANATPDHRAAVEGFLKKRVPEFSRSGASLSPAARSGKHRAAR